MCSSAFWGGRLAGMAEGREGKQVVETKPAPRAGRSLGLLQGPLQEGCSPRTNPVAPLVGQDCPLASKAQPVWWGKRK